MRGEKVYGANYDLIFTKSKKVHGANYDFATPKNQLHGKWMH